MPLRRAHPEQIERTLRDIHRESMQAIDKKKGEQEIKHLQLLIVVLPDGSGQYGE